MHIGSINGNGDHSSIQQRYVEVSDDDDDDLLEHLDANAVEERNSASSPPLRLFRPIDDRSAAPMLVPLSKACFQQMGHRVEVDVEGDASIQFESIQTADGGLMRKRMLARLRQRQYRERQKRRQLEGYANQEDNDVCNAVATGRIGRCQQCDPTIDSAEGGVAGLERKCEAARLRQRQCRAHQKEQNVRNSRMASYNSLTMN
ncbi:hypothetical protein PC129_g10135 [Phytophthora cactorum]|uniref:Uncharacterized protein n=1 Tax=Phytophthora cactorum TaxID=29920 RepID=A0A8T1I2D0_9STRA|nr:hypothetical protein PC112_g11674 [Phytophthora cactorum]KAG2822691.1 hypothetical protein PC111_g10540 [Phytophthora cactorum]KAG2855721.1 hypothetical protein PC113_g12202 [Phytophthora cactorum]KAG2889000.1 hypothetical protein PC115_g19885 [Phytophthora cactorum]KAG2902068.1 hypothetical protein PC114_g12885 [Phytophthora cactorum]